MKKDLKKPSQMNYKHFFIVGVMFIITLFSLNLISASIWDTNQPVAYFKLDETSGKNISNVVNATYNGSLNTAFEDVNWVAGKLGNGLLFNQSTSWTNFSNASSLNIVNDTSYSFWINFTAHTTSNAGVFAIGKQGLELRDSGSNQFSFGFADSGTQSISTANNMIVANRWYHIVITQSSGWVNQTNTKMYINGTLQTWTGISTYYQQLTGMGGRFNLGYNPYNLVPINGSIDEFGIWNKTLTQTEVTELYNSGAGLEYSEIKNISVSLNSPAIGSNVIVSENFTGTFNITSENLLIQTLKNATYNIWYANGSLISQTTETISGIGNSTTIKISGFSYSGLSYKWNIYVCANNSECRWALSNYTFSTPPFIFGLCNTTLTTSYINLTFKSENGTIMNSTIPASSWQYWLDGSNANTNETFSFSNLTQHQNYAFCFSPTDKTINIKTSVQYSIEGFPQRIWQNTTTLTNSTTNKTLYLLGSTDGIYVTFQVINSAEQPIEGVYSTAKRIIDGVLTTIGEGTTGAEGGITFWLNPDYLHTFSFVNSGYTTYETSFIPTQSSYTIKLGGTSTATEYDYTIGISYSILPSSTYLDNNTDYSFNFTISSTYWSLDSYGFTLTLNNGSVLGSTSDTTDTGGTINLNVNTMNATSIRMDFYYVVNGSYQNMSRNWIIYNTESNEFSIWFLINRFKTYMNSSDGIFGLKSNSFGLNLFIYVLILVIVGIMSYSFSVSSPSAVLGMLFGLVALFDVVLGLLYNPPLATAVGVNNFPTILMGIILFGVIIKEAYS